MDRRGRAQRQVTADVFAYRRGKVRYYRYPDGTLQGVAPPSTPSATVLERFTASKHPKRPVEAAKADRVEVVGSLSAEKVKMCKAIGIDTRWGERLLRKGR
jgi:hypothetical protein